MKLTDAQLQQLADRYERSVESLTHLPDDVLEAMFNAPIEYPGVKDLQAAIDRADEIEQG